MLSSNYIVLWQNGNASVSEADILKDLQVRILQGQLKEHRVEYRWCFPLGLKPFMFDDMDVKHRSSNASALGCSGENRGVPFLLPFDGIWINMSDFESDAVRFAGSSPAGATLNDF